METAPKTKKPVILLADDNKAMLDTMYAILEGAGMHKNYRIEIAESGNEGMELIRSLHEAGRELVLIDSDYMMIHSILGDAFLVDAHRIYPDAVKMMHSGQCETSAVINALNHARLFRFITVPFSTEEYLAHLAEALRYYNRQKAFNEFTRNRELSLK